MRWSWDDVAWYCKLYSVRLCFFVIGFVVTVFLLTNDRGRYGPREPIVEEITGWWWLAPVTGGVAAAFFGFRFRRNPPDDTDISLAEIKARSKETKRRER